MRSTRQARSPGTGAGAGHLGWRAAVAVTLAGAMGVAPVSGVGVALASGAAAASPGVARAATGSAASWRIVKTTRGRDLPAVTAVTATGPGQAWAFASTLARPVAWRLTGRALGGGPVPRPGR